MLGKRSILAILAVLVWGGLASSPAQAGWSFGLNLNLPVRPHCYHPPHHYHHYRPVYPVYVRPRPVYVQPVQVYESVERIEPSYVQPAPVRNVPTPVSTSVNGDIDYYLRKMQHHDEGERLEAARQLGRLKASRAVSVLQVSLSNDRSAVVREAAARSLGLIGSTEALAGLDRATQSDESEEVRKSASFSAEVIRAHFTSR